MPLLDPSSVLTAVARLAAEAVTLTELVPRLAAVVREAIPFERLHVLRLDRAESIVLYVARADGELEVTGHRIADAESVSNAANAADERSRIICTVGRGSSIHGALWLTSTQPHAFSDAHQTLMDGVADLLALALQQDAMRSTESLRREQINTLDRLLNTMAEALDIRHIFAEVSGSVRAGLPHDVLLLTAWARGWQVVPRVRNDGSARGRHRLLGADHSDRRGAGVSSSRSRTSLMTSWPRLRRAAPGAGYSPGSAYGRPCVYRCRSAPACSARSFFFHEKRDASASPTSTSPDALRICWRSHYRINGSRRRPGETRPRARQPRSLRREWPH